MTRLITVIIYLVAALNFVFGLFFFITLHDPIAELEPVMGQTFGFWLVAYSLLLLVVARRFEHDVTWLVIPILLEGFNDLHNVYEAYNVLARIPGHRDNGIFVPLVIDTVVIAILLIGYIRLRRSHPGQAALWWTSGRGLNLEDEVHLDDQGSLHCSGGQPHRG
jgi:hypothetical protein